MSDFIGKVPSDIGINNIAINSSLTGCNRSSIRVRQIEACTGIFGTGGGNGSSLQIIPDGDSLAVSPNTNQAILFDGQSGIVGFGLTSPSNTLTVRDLRNLSPFVVGIDPTSSEYQSVSAAITAANASATPQNILLQAGFYTGENITLTQPQVVTAAGKNTSVINTSTITFNLNNSFFFENVVFLNTTFNLGSTAIVVFYNCRFLGCTMTGTGASVQFFECVTQGGSINLNGGNTIEMNNSVFGTPITIQNASILNGPVNCIFSEVVIDAPLSQLVFTNCTFRNNFATFTNFLPNVPSVFNNCIFETITLTFSNSGLYILTSCFVIGVTFTTTTGINLYSTQSIFSNTTFTPFLVGAIIQFVKCELNLVQPLVFQGVAQDFQTLRFCSVNNNLTNTLNPMIIIDGATARLRTTHCSFDGDNPTGTSSVIFEFQNGAELILFSASLICGQPNYATGTGTIIRPATTNYDSGTGTTSIQGTNFMQGPGGISGTITVPDAFTPNWNNGVFTVV